jgi:negative regulator of flagellin synthesis FlgM
MKIDPRILLPADVQSTPVQNSRNTAAQSATKSSTGLKPSAGEDTVKISTTHSDLQLLKANLANIPEVRVAKVNALRQQVNSGQYKPDSQKVADAIIADHSRRAKA